MTAELDIDITVGPVRVLPVPASSGSAKLLNGPCRLYGWSLQDTGSAVPVFKDGTVTTPTAGQTIVSFGTLPAGEYTVDVLLQIAGTPAAADANNMEITGPPGGPFILLNQGAVGEYPQEPITFTLTAPTLCVIRAIALATSGAIYSAEVTITPMVGLGTEATIQDGNNIMGALTLGASQSDTKWFGPMGVAVLSEINLVVASGQIQGAVYAAFQR